MKKILIATPSLTRHGGIRVILEWANRLAERHVVHLFSLQEQSCDWFDISPKVLRCSKIMDVEYDLFIITSPHSLNLSVNAKKKVIFLQMMEHHFRPNDKAWHAACMATYLSELPVISISRWNMDEMRKLGRRGATFYVGNGVNLEHFPISAKSKDFKSVLVEGLIPSNPSKDSMEIAAKAASQLHKDGYRILAYSANYLTRHTEFVDKFIRNPSLKEMNELYEEATILVKASKLDARSCSPVEAMTKGTVTARAIIMGDDDLVNGQNCLRGGYNAVDLYRNAKQLLTCRGLHADLADAGRRHVIEQSWDFWMKQIELILWQEIGA